MSGYPLHIVGASEAESQLVAEPGWLEWLVAESASSPGSAEPPSSAIPSCAPSSTNTAPDKPKHAPCPASPTRSRTCAPHSKPSPTTSDATKNDYVDSNDEPAVRQAEELRAIGDR